jgi:HD-GYP domain-containing protein (c-di-GMP phosphodiesterase class II)
MHTRGVLNLAIAVSEELQLDPIARRNTELGALLHDVGKVVIPNEIINKNGPLDDDEWTLIKTHTIEGQRILDEIGGLMSTVGRVVRAAHERWDGGGYPDGLRGEEIPLESRVIFCCDAMNAMTTMRSYRKARPPREALAELQANAGSQFDPEVVTALTAVVERDLARSQHAAQVVT